MQRQRKMTAAMIEKRFQRVPADLQQRLDRLSVDELNDLCLRVIDAVSLEDLGLS